MIFGREPAVVAASVVAALNLAIGFGLDLTTEQVALINTALLAVLAVVVRQKVTPV